jgi:hypothetical protein
VGKDQPHAQKRVYIPRPTNITGVSSARRFSFFIFIFRAGVAAKQNAFPDAAERKYYEVAYLG